MKQENFISNRCEETKRFVNYYMRNLFSFFFQFQIDKNACIFDR